MGQSLTLPELQEESLKILKDIHVFCSNNNIMYSIGYGTLLGAIRHKGFIPWDDDIDIIMPREHYDKFCKHYKSEKFKLKSPKTSEDYYLAFARVFDDQLTISKTRAPWHAGENGVWVDVFPIDYVSDDKEIFESHKRVLRWKWKTISWSRQAKVALDSSYPFIVNLKLVIKKIITINGLLLRHQLNSFMEKANSIIEQKSGHWSQLTCMDGYEWHKTSSFTHTIPMIFEDTEVMVMNGYDDVLKECYGDYMKLPPVEKRVGHSDGITTFYWKEDKMKHE